MNDFQELTGQMFGPSDWQTVSQAQVDTFAAATGDHQWLHVDPERARIASPYGRTVAHGMLTLSLAPALVMTLLPLGDALVINYGLDRVRFPAPLLVGSQVRLWAELSEVKSVGPGVQLTVDVRLQSKEQEKPVCVARYLFVVRKLREGDREGVPG